jgi:hypothetical protein
MQERQNVYFKQRTDGSVTALFDYFKEGDDLAEILDSVPYKEYTAMLIAYREDQWEAMRAAADDRDELHSTWREWSGMRKAKNTWRNLRREVFPYVWMPFDRLTNANNQNLETHRDLNRSSARAAATTG